VPRPRAVLSEQPMAPPSAHGNKQVRVRVRVRVRARVRVLDTSIGLGLGLGYGNKQVRVRVRVGVRVLDTSIGLGLGLGLGAHTATSRYAMFPWCAGFGDARIQRGRFAKSRELPISDPVGAAAAA
jgi:hypothetical protein